MNARPFPVCSRRSVWLAALALSTLTALTTDTAVGAEKKPSAQAAVSSEISVTLVEIPVEVTRGGEPVKGLTAADFEVVEEGRSLPVVAFETVDLEAPETPGAPPPPPAARRHLLLLFDFALSRPEKLVEGIAASRELLAKGLDPSDMMAVGIYLPKGELHLLLSFTNDRAAAARILTALEGVMTGKAPPEAVGGESDPLRLTGLGARSLLAQAWQVDERNFADEMRRSLGPSDGTWGSFLQHNVLNHSAILHQPHVDARMRSHVMALAESMESLTDTLRPVQGRKYLTLFSEGFSMQLINRPNSGGPDSTAGGGSILLAKLERTFEELRRSGWVVHSVDLAGVRGSGGTDGLFYLANETGGTLVEGTNKLAEGLDGALRRSAHGYLLTVQIDDVALDGAYHRLNVRLRESPRGTRIHHRGGYFAPLPFSRQKDVQRLAEAAVLVSGGEERDDLGIQVVAVPLRAGAGGPVPVAVLVEVPGAPLLAQGAPRLGLEVFGYALDGAGNSSDFFANAVDLDRAKVGDRLARGGVRVLGRLDLPAGEHRLRVLVRDRSSGRSSLLSVPVSLSATTAEAGAARIDALFLPPPEDPWLLVRPADAAFDLHGRSVLPAAHGAVPAAGETQVLLVGSGFTGQGAWIKGRILTADGKAAADGGLELLTITPGESGEPDLVVGRLRAGSLPPGSYLLELRVGRERSTQAVTMRPFVVAAGGKLPG